MTSVEPTPRAQREVPWRAREGFVIWLLALVVTVLPAVFLHDDRDSLTVGILIANELALLAVTLLWVRNRYGLGPGAVGLRRVRQGDVGSGLRTGLLGIGVAYAIAVVLLQILRIFDDDVSPPKQVDLQADPSTSIIVLLGIGVVLLAPIAEEVFFRGFLYPAIRRWARVGPAAVLSGAGFAIAHLHPLIIPAIFALGILLARLVERRGSIVPSIVAHMTFNAVGFSILVLSPGAT